MVQLGYARVRIDLINTVDGVNFEECFRRKSIIEIEGLTVNFISLEDLLKNKKAAAHPRNINVIENLTK